MNAQPIPCQDGCKRNAADEADAQAKGWTRMPLTGRYRCPDCVRALAKVNEGYAYPSTL